MEQLGTVDALVRLSFLVQGAVAQAAAARELSVTQVRLLAVLRDREPGMQELAAHLELDTSSVSGLVDRASRRGLVVRSPSAVDGRAVTVSLTAAGWRVAAAIEREIAAAVTALAAPLTARQSRDLAASTAKILAAVPGRSG